MRKNKPVNPIAQYFPEINSVSHSPRFQVIATNGVLELLVNTLIEKKCRNERAHRFNYSSKLVLLNEMDILPDLQFKLLDAFRELRNRAAHGGFDLTSAMLMPFADMSYRTARKDLEKPENFQHLCNILVCGFWNDNIGIFGSYFENLPPTAFHPKD
jgi:hypothetical protein